MKKVLFYLLMCLMLLSCKHQRTENQTTTSNEEQSVEFQKDTIQADSILIDEEEIEAKRLEEWYGEDIQTITDAIIHRKKEVLANHTNYPYWQPYPLKHIESPEEFIRHFDRIVPDTMPTLLQNSSLSDWNRMGYRGVMYGNGSIWLDEDGRLRSIGYPGLRAKKKEIDLEAARAKERRLLGLPASAVPELCFIDSTKTTMVYLYCDTAKQSPDDWHKKGHYIRLYHRGSTLQNPDFEEPAMWTVEGSCGNRTFVAQNDSLTVIFVPDNCEFSNKYCLTYPTHRRYADWKDYESDRNQYDYTRYDYMIYSYLWEVAEWW